jgi:hypothetical protein
MKSKNKIKFFISVLLLSLFFGISSCQSNDSLDTIQDPDLPDPDSMFQSLQCSTQIEQSDYSIYKIASNDEKSVVDSAYHGCLWLELSFQISFK